ncbi:RING finger protein 10 [Athalia rosae]|uniref:RING finger protein 10 n=1 Tax=Athalia rosae TaxID=37344 RepID=UPI0020338B7C|nr:RING finger protein 10 [Athalia rosae]
MEKKSRLTQSSAKGPAGDAKKNQDIVNGKVFPKNSRRREPTSAVSSTKNEQLRKTTAQRGKNVDKRPKPKGQYHGGPKEDTKVEEGELAEHGSVMIQGSKKQNLNHLLNFHYEPRDIHGTSGAWSPGRSTSKYNRNSNRWLPPVQRHKYNKEQFLQANCQFIVKSSGDYSAYLADPDILVEWDLIEQIRVHSSEILSCPICLCVPVAAKMTRCGHVYCWPCILHYLALSDKSWRKCPICYEAIHKRDLKSVVEVTQKAWNVDDTVCLRLMRRERDSLLAVPVDPTSNISVPTTFFSLLQDNTDVIYSKLLLANSNNLADIVECERVQLKLELEEDPQSPENCFIEQALSELVVREEKLFAKVDEAKSDPGPVKCSDSKRESPPTEIGENVDPFQPEQPIEFEDQLELLEDRLDLGDESEENHVPCAVDSAMECPASSASPKFFYFYQAEDGQHIYLHAMNTKMLELQYGSLEKSPPIITGKLLEKEAGSMTEQLRRRLRYLYHLPLTCQFEIAEIDLKPPIISKGNLAVFSDQLENRKKRRQRRAREERKREKKILEEENKRMGKYPTPNVHIDSQRHFPQWQPDSSFAGINIPSPPESVTTSSAASSPTINSFDIHPTADCHEVGPSFAQMLRTTGSRGASKIDWPRVDPTNLPRHPGEEVEGYVPAPSYSQSFGDALAEALEHTELNSGNGTNKGGSGKKKKKRGKPTVLFATSMARAS